MTVWIIVLTTISILTLQLITLLSFASFVSFRELHEDIKWSSSQKAKCVSKPRRTTKASSSKRKKTISDVYLL